MTGQRQPRLYSPDAVLAPSAWDSGFEAPQGARCYYVGIRLCLVFLLVIVLTCRGQDGADDGPRVVFPEPGVYDSATECEWIFDSSFEYGNVFYSWYYPLSYTPNIQCLFFFEAGENEVVEVAFNSEFSIENSEGCKYDYLEIRDGRYGYSPLIKRVCGEVSPGNITSSGRYLWILFVTDEDLEYTGFEAYFRFIPAPVKSKPVPPACFFHLSGSYDGTFSIKPGVDMMRTEDLHAPVDCTWQIDMPEVNKILLEFLKFNVFHKNNCEENRVQIFDKYSTYEWMIREYCSTTAPAAMTLSNRMFVRFIASNRSAYNEVNMSYTAYLDRPCTGESNFPCGPFMCINTSLVCNGRRNCWSYAFDEKPEMCEVETKSGFFEGRVDIALAVTMGIILTVTVTTIIVTCRHSCLRTREKARTMASRRTHLNQQVQILMDGENAESHEMNSLGSKYSTKYGNYAVVTSTTGNSSATSGNGVKRSPSCSHDFPMTAAQLKDYERIMDSELGFEPRQNRTSLMEPDSPWVRANQYNESFRRSSNNPLSAKTDGPVKF